MKFFDTLDDQFIRLADHEEQRSAALDGLKSSRLGYYLGGLLLMAATVAIKMSGSDVGLGFALFGVFCFCLAFKRESDIRILRMVDHLEKRNPSRLG